MYFKSLAYAAKINWSRYEVYKLLFSYMILRVKQYEQGSLHR